jgi:hypothetical protein
MHPETSQNGNSNLLVAGSLPQPSPDIMPKDCPIKYGERDHGNCGPPYWRDVGIVKVGLDCHCSHHTEKEREDAFVILHISYQSDFCMYALKKYRNINPYDL